MRWKKIVGGLALSLTLAAGCKQPIYMTEDDFARTRKDSLLPKALEEDPNIGSLQPCLDGKVTPVPANVFDPDRPPHYLSLTEAFALAMENGTVGQANGSLSEIQSGLGTSTSGGGGAGLPGGRTDSIRALALEPAIFATNIESSLSRFDTRWVSSMNWNTTDRPVGTALDAFQARQGINAISTQAAEFRSSLIKQLPTGGVAGITFDNQYQFTNLPARVNPSYTPSLQFSFEQPLLQGFGVEINQIRAAHPGGLLQNDQLFPQALPGTPGTNQGILITRIAQDQARTAFEYQVQSMLENVEIAYWNLYSAYGQLFAREIALRNNLEVWRITRTRVEAGYKGFTQADLYESLGQYESSRSDWLASLGLVLENERILRQRLGLPVEDRQRLVPSDTPTMAPFRPDWEMALQEALVLRPELVFDREQLKATQLNLVELKNRLLPDLRFTSTYDVNGIGSRLDGGSNDNAWRSLASNHFNDWSLGLNMTVPIGFRDANAGVRQGRLRLAQSYYALRTDEDKVQRELALHYRHILEFQEQIQRNLASLEAYNNELNVRRESVRSGKEVAIDITLQAIRFGSASMVQYYQFVGQYNGALASFERAKGTILRRDNVVLADGPLPACAQVRAVEHEQERAKALVLRERAAPVPCADQPGEPSLVVPPKPDTLSLPELFRSRQPLPPDVNEPQRLPPPRTLDQLPPGETRKPAPPAPTKSAPASPAAPVTTPVTTGDQIRNNFGVVRQLEFPEDKKSPPPLPSLSGPDLGDGTK